MRYFKYKNTDKNMNNAIKEHYLTLSKDLKLAARKKKAWQTCGSVVGLISFGCCFFASIYLLKIIPNPSNVWLMILVTICKVIAGFLLLLISGLLTFVIINPILKKVESYRIPQIRKDVYSKACAHLRKYYKLQESYVLTKCYDSTDEKFKNHDVCIFVVDDELRITTDLINGFLHGHRDLGCYAFKREEIDVSKKVDGKLLCAMLKTENICFLLGYRAKRFIEKNFLKAEEH